MIIINHFGYIYKTTNIKNNKIYIGKKESNVFDDEYLGSGKLIRRAIEKYGHNSFSVEVLGWYESLDALNRAEINFIKLYESQDKNIGYNIASGGDGGNLIQHLDPDEYARFVQECSDRTKGKNNPNYNNGDKISGERNPAKRPEVRKKISLAVSGKGNGMYGKSQTPESLEKKLNTTLDRYGFIPNRYSVNKNNWRYIVCRDSKQITRTKTELIRVLSEMGFSPTVIKQCFDFTNTNKEVYINSFDCPMQSKNRHAKALKKFEDIKIERYNETTPR